MDVIDQKLLQLLQENAQTSQADLAKAVALSSAGVHKRIQKLHQDGLIRKSVALLDRGNLGLDLLCFLKVSFKNNLEFDNLPALKKAVQKLPEVLECYTLTGSHDAILKVVVRDHVALREFLKRLSTSQKVLDKMETCIVLEEIKEGTALPL